MVCLTDGASGSRMSYALADIGIATGLAIGDRAETLPYLNLKHRSLQVQPQIEFAQLAVEIIPELRRRLRQQTGFRVSLRGAELPTQLPDELRFRRKG
jgi:hypothetical protein